MRHISIVTQNGKNLNKSFDASTGKMTGEYAQIFDGNYIAKEFSTLEDLQKILASVAKRTDAVSITGVCKFKFDNWVRIASQAQLKKEYGEALTRSELVEKAISSGVITRTKEFFHFPEKHYAALDCDHDSIDHEEFVAEIQKIFSVDLLFRPSASYGVDGSKRGRFYVLTNGISPDEVIRRLNAKLSYSLEKKLLTKVSGVEEFLPALDVAMGRETQPDYCGKPANLPANFIRPEPIIYRGEYQEISEDSIPIVLPNFPKSLDNIELPTWETGSLNPEYLKDKRAIKGTIDHNHLLYLNRNETITAAQLLSMGREVRLCDPWEPEYCNFKQTATYYPSQRAIYSLAHSRDVLPAKTLILPPAKHPRWFASQYLLKEIKEQFPTAAATFKVDSVKLDLLANRTVMMSKGQSHSLLMIDDDGTLLAFPLEDLHRHVAGWHGNLLSAKTKMQLSKDILASYNLALSSFGVTISHDTNLKKVKGEPQIAVDILTSALSNDLDKLEKCVYIGATNYLKRYRHCSGIEYNQNPHTFDFWFESRERQDKIYSLNCAFRLPKAVYRDARGAYRQDIVTEFNGHFPEMADVVDAMVATAFVKDRKNAWLWLKAPTNFGKSFLFGPSGVFSDISIELGEKEMDRMVNGEPVGIAPTRFLDSLVMVTEEARKVSHANKMIQNTIPVTAKYEMQQYVPVRFKIIISAEHINSLITEDGIAEGQMMTRFSQIDRTGSGRLDELPLFNKYGPSNYYASIRTYACKLLVDEFERIIQMNEDEARIEAEKILKEFHAKYGLHRKAKSIEQAAPDLEVQFLQYVANHRPDVIKYVTWQNLPCIVIDHANIVFKEWIDSEHSNGLSYYMKNKGREMLEKMSYDSNIGSRQVIYNGEPYVVRGVLLLETDPRTARFQKNQRRGLR